MSFLDKFLNKKTSTSPSKEVLDDLMFITDVNLKVLSINSAVESTLGLASSQVIDRNLFEILFLRNENSELLDEKLLGLNGMLLANQSNIIEGLTFLTRNSPTSFKVNLKVKPYVNFAGKIDRISFRILDASKILTTSETNEIDLEPVITKHQGSINDIRGELFSKGYSDLGTQLELATETEKDIFTMNEILSTPGIKPNPRLVDIAQLCERIILNRQYRAKILNVSLSFDLQKFKSQSVTAPLPQNLNITPEDITSVYFTTKVDFRWFDRLIQKLVDFSIFLASSSQYPIIKLTLENINSVIILKLFTASPNLNQEKQNMIFIQNYDALGNETNLKLGSGLEGLIIKMITEKLSLPLKINFDPQTSNLIFSLELPGSSTLPTAPQPSGK